MIMQDDSHQNSLTNEFTISLCNITFPPKVLQFEHETCYS